eukprot:1160467-Pelagomonas_calceolata.AAC.4
MEGAWGAAQLCFHCVATCLQHPRAKAGWKSVCGHRSKSRPRTRLLRAHQLNVLLQLVCFKVSSNFKAKNMENLCPRLMAPLVSLTGNPLQLLAKCGATLYMVCRNAERGQKAVKSVQDKTGNPNVHLRLCDDSKIEWDGMEFALIGTVCNAAQTPTKNAHDQQSGPQSHSGAESPIVNAPLTAVSSVKSVLGLAAELDQPGSKIDVLIQNAGVLGVFGASLLAPRPFYTDLLVGKTNTVQVLFSGCLKAFVRSDSMYSISDMTGIERVFSMTILLAAAKFARGGWIAVFSQMIGFGRSPCRAS